MQQLSGHALLQHYRTQAHKLLRYVRHQYMAKMTGSEGARIRLELLLDEYAQKGTLPQPEGWRLNA